MRYAEKVFFFDPPWLYVFGRCDYMELNCLVFLWSLYIYIHIYIYALTYLYKSESPSQVAIFLIAFFCLVMKDIPDHIRSTTKYFLAYDNICNLSNMKLWREPLPIRRFQNIWKENLIKITDSLHMHNHKRESCHSCHTTYNPAILKKRAPKCKYDDLWTNI